MHWRSAFEPVVNSAVFFSIVWLDHNNMLHHCCVDWVDSNDLFAGYIQTSSACATYLYRIWRLVLLCRQDGSSSVHKRAVRFWHGWFVRTRYLKKVFIHTSISSLLHFEICRLLKQHNCGDDHKIYDKISLNIASGSRFCLTLLVHTP